MVDILIDPEMIGFKRGKPIYQIRHSEFPIENKKYIEEDLRNPYRSSRAGCL